MLHFLHAHRVMGGHVFQGWVLKNNEGGQVPLFSDFLPELLQGSKQDVIQCGAGSVMIAVPLRLHQFHVLIHHKLDGIWRSYIGLSKFGKFRSEEHTSELQSLMRISYAVFCLKKKKYIKNKNTAQKISNKTQQ